MILSAVACAGKAYHHTDNWSEETPAYEYHEGATPVDWIQNAADKAAAAWNRRPTDTPAAAPLATSTVADSDGLKYEHVAASPRYLRPAPSRQSGRGTRREKPFTTPTEQRNLR